MDAAEAAKECAFARSGGRCECKRSAHSHPDGRCTNIISPDEAHYHSSNGSTVSGDHTIEVVCRYCMISMEASNSDGT
jgi:hypothetical protein